MDSCRISTDAVPKSSKFNNFDQTACRTFDDTYTSILEKFTIDNYKSFLFLLIDYKIKLDQFLYFSKKEKADLKKIIQEMNLEERTFIECLGTMKMYSELKYFGTCYHVFESKKQDFDEIKEIWKTLYTLSEEIDDNDLKVMKEYIPNDFQVHVVSAEEWFACAVKSEIITRTDLLKLKKVFQNNSVCLNIINDFEGPKIAKYKIRTPTTNSPCGIALIFNFEIFFEKLDLKKRNGSQVDVDSLEKLWKTFGFKTHIFQDLTVSESLKKLRMFSYQDLSKYDVFVCCILSHGASNVIYASDGKIPIHELIAVISSSESLNEKPKLFFIQACQGSNLMMTEGSKVQQSCVPIDVNIYPIGIDVYVAVATLNGFTSFRSTTEGTWFIQALCEAMKIYADQYSLTDIFSRVTRDVAKNIYKNSTGEKAKQIVPTFSTLQKLLFFKKNYH